MKYLMITVLIYVCTSCTQKDQKPLITGKEGQRLPDFELLLPDSAAFFRTASIPKNMPVVIFYFSPNCPYCRMQMRRIINNISEFSRRTQFVVVTSKGFKEMKSFAREFKNNGHHNISVGYDPKRQVVSYYRPAAVPFLAIYGKDKKLKNSFIGAISMRQMKAIISS